VYSDNLKTQENKLAYVLKKSALILILKNLFYINLQNLTNYISLFPIVGTCVNLHSFTQVPLLGSWHFIGVNNKPFIIFQGK